MPPAKSNVQDKRILPSKEAALFKELLSLYEAQQLKKAQKTADQILKKFAEHGETLAMKGLVTFQMGRKDEGLELIRKGIRFDLTSHIVWHVFGLAKKAEKDYEEAVKSYQQALRYDKDNINILRDAANMYIQLRNFEPLEDLRLQILRLRPNVRQHWIALAVAYQLNGHLKDALRILETYKSILKDIPSRNLEHSQVLSYHLQLLEQMQEYEKALQLLATAEGEDRTLDVTAFLECRARLEMKLQDQVKADHHWRQLVDLNPDNVDYYKNLLLNKGVVLDKLTPDMRDAGLKQLAILSNLYPHSLTARRLALDVAEGHQFRHLLRSYLIDGFRRGVPSLFVDVKSLLRDPGKHSIISDVAESLHKTSTSSLCDPTVTMWSMYFLAQHASSVGDQLTALSRIRWLEEHTPTLPEVYMLKAKALKRGGDLLGASQVMEDARTLDLQDRFLNWKASKYMLRAGRPENAQRILGLFTKKDAPSPGFDLEEMQCLAYLVEEVDAQCKAGYSGSALKYCKRIEKIFLDIEDDQFDFHGYAIRKFNLEPYTDVIHWENGVRDDPIYAHAVVQAAKIYLNPQDALQAADGGKQYQKRPKKVAASGIDVEPNAKHVFEDEDPYGFKLLKVSDPLKHAASMLKVLEDLDSKRIGIWLTSFDVALKRGQWLQAARAIEHASRLNNDDPEVYWRAVQLKLGSASLEGSVVMRAVQDVVGMILPGSIPEEIRVAEYLQRHPGDGRATLALTKVRQLLGQSHLSWSSLEDLLVSTLVPGIQLDLKTAQELFDELRSNESSHACEAFLRIASQCFPLCPRFIQLDMCSDGLDGSDSEHHEILF